MFDQSSDDFVQLVDEIIASSHQIQDNSIYNLTNTYHLPTVVFLGTAVVGKSSLVNALFGGREITQVSSVPLSFEPTKEQIWMGGLKLVDSASYDQSPEESELNLNRADAVVHVCNMGAIRRSDIELARLIQDTEKPFITVLNMSDLYNTVVRKEILKQVKLKIGQEPICTSAKSGENLGNLVISICQILPEISQTEVIEKIAQQANKIQNENTRKQTYNRQRSVCEKIIREAAQEAAKIGATLVPASDLGQLIALHTNMVTKIGSQYFEDGPTQQPYTVEATALTLLRSALQVAIKLIPIGGSAIGSLTAMIWTHSVGQAAIEFYEKQIKLEQIPQRTERFILVSSHKNIK